MRSVELDLNAYDTDKIASHYLDKYDPFFNELTDKNICLLELGIYKGGSLQLWRDYFPHGKVVGIDLQLPEGFSPGERISIYQGNQADTNFLTRVAAETAPQGFDIIIDDASHMGELTKIAFWHLFTHHLKPGGLYVIEDWGTGYWQDWPDGKSLDLDRYLQSKTRYGLLYRGIRRLSRVTHIGFGKFPMAGHNYGMVGLIKQLVDEQGAADASRRKWANSPKRSSRFESMTILPSIVFIKKSVSNA